MRNADPGLREQYLREDPGHYNRIALIMRRNDYNGYVSLDFEGNKSTNTAIPTTWPCSARRSQQRCGGVKAPRTDAAVLSCRADDVVLVVRAGHTGRDDTQHALRQLFAVGAHVVGVVIDDPDSKLPGHDGVHNTGIAGPMRSHAHYSTRLLQTCS